MRIVVDLVRCQTYGRCVFAAPTVFELHGDKRKFSSTSTPLTSRCASRWSGRRLPAPCRL
jgi:ferredoxin